MAIRCLIGMCMLSAGVVCAGCGDPIAFPRASLEVDAASHGALRAYDTNGDGGADFFLFAGAAGRVERLGYDRSGDGAPDSFVNLDDNPVDRSRHLVIVLDGVTFDLVRELYEAGDLRIFHPPSRVITPYPSMTDLGMAQMLGDMPPLAYEAKYFDHRRNRMVGGKSAYMAETNEAHLRLIQYKAHTLWRVMGFVWPSSIFNKELRTAIGRYDEVDSREFIAYFGSTAGMGTRLGADGHRETLRRIERWAHQVLWQSRGLAEVTLMSDHGHTYTPGQPLPAAAHLKDRGWRLRSTLADDRDVVWIRFGLLTFASFATRDPAALADDLADCEGVDITSYADGETVVVLDGNDGRAVIGHRGGRYRYALIRGDPLQLGDILKQLSPDADGYYDADDLLAATADHVYPAPLQRMWQGHFTVVQNPPDVVCSLADGTFAGSSGLAGAVSIESTHGGLNRRNSTAFIMSTIGPLPPLMRSSDISGHMGVLIGGPWPMGK